MTFKKRLKLILPILCLIALIAGPIAYMFGAFQKDFVARRYAIAVKMNDQLMRIDGLGTFAFTKDYFDPKEIYVDAKNLETVEFFYDLARHQIKTNPLNSDDMRILSRIELNQNLVKNTTVQVNAYDTYQLMQLYDHKGNLILSYSDNKYAPKHYKKNAYIKNIVTTGMCRSHGNGGCNPVKDPYINLTEILVQHFNTRLNYRVDPEQRLIIITAQKL